MSGQNINQDGEINNEIKISLEGEIVDHAENLAMVRISTQDIPDLDFVWLVVEINDGEGRVIGLGLSYIEAIRDAIWRAEEFNDKERIEKIKALYYGR
jgi:predicted RNA-binding protein YlqC (UPF0109 family)